MSIHRAQLNGAADRPPLAAAGETPASALRKVPRTLQLYTRCLRVPHGSADELPAARRVSWGLGLAFLLAADTAAWLRATAPFEHGWWLVSYLALVGCVAPLLLARGRAALLSRLRCAQPSRAWLWYEIGLWNVGAMVVPVGVLTDGAATVGVGSVLLLVALALYAAGLYRSARAAPSRRGAWERAYYTLVGFLIGSVMIGTGLADALPWQ